MVINRKWISLFVVGLLVSLIGSASCSQQSAELTVNESSNNKTVRITEGSSLKVVLNSNRTTGFTWELTQNDNTILQKLNNTYENPKTDSGAPLVGAGGSEIWNFKALKKGTNTLKMEYNQPWNGGTKGAELFNLTVNVE